MRIMGLDSGLKTAGVITNDAPGPTAQGVETIIRKDKNKLRQMLVRIETLTGGYEIETIVLGYLKNINDTVGEWAEKTEEFKAMLERRTELPMILWGERLTAVVAGEILIKSGVRKEHRKEVIDKIAASIILQGYLGSI